MTHTRRLVSGSALRVANLLAGIGISFYIYPFVVHSLGDYWSGFWQLAGTIVGYYGLLDLGLNNATHRFLALAAAREDRDETSRVFTTTMGLFGAGGIIILGLTALAWLLAPVKASPADLPIVRPVILLLGINFALSFPMQVFNGILAANLRYDLSSYLELSKVIVRTAVVIVAVRRAPTVVTLALVTFIVDVVWNAMMAFVAWRLWPWLTLHRRFFDRGRVREFYTYGLFAFLVRVGDLVRFSVDTLVVGSVLGLAVVAHYGIAMRLTDYFQSLLNQVFGVLTPVFSRYHGLDDTAAMFHGVRQASRFAVAVSVSVAGAAIIFGEPFIARWMGPSYVDAYWPLVILTAATLLGVMQTPSTSYLFAIAKHRYYALLNGGDAIANFALSIVLAHRFGMIGVALGTAIPAIVAKLFFQPRYVCKQLGVPVSAYWRDVGRVLSLTMASQAAIGAIVWVIGPKSYTGLFSLAIGLNAIHALVVYLFILPGEDQRVLAHALPRLNSILAIRGGAAASSR